MCKDNAVNRCSVRVPYRMAHSAEIMSCSTFTKRNQPTLRFVPKGESDTGKALHKGEPADLREFRVLAQHTRQAIERDAAAEVMYVVDADIRSQPAQDTRKIVMRTAMKRRVMQIPVLIITPIGVLELMLDIK